VQVQTSSSLGTKQHGYNLSFTINTN
jgi:hypothetical protein